MADRLQFKGMGFGKAGLLALLLGAGAGVLSAEEASSRWKRTGELSGRSINVGKAFSDARLLEKGLLSLAFNAGRFDPEKPVRFEVKPAVKLLKIEALDAKGKPVEVKTQEGGAHVEVRAGEIEFRPFDGTSIAVSPRTQETALARLLLHFEPGAPVREVDMYYTPAGASLRVNMAPTIAESKVVPQERKMEVVHQDGKLILRNKTLEAVLELDGGLRLVALHNALTGRNMLKKASGLFLIDQGKGRVADGSQWNVEKVEVEADAQKGSKVARIYLKGSTLDGVVSLTVDDEELRTGLEIINSSGEPQQWKTVFPALEGLAVSERPDDDYYLFPYYTGVVQNVNTDLRLFYGGNEAYWQMIDLFSPQAGCGISVHCLDETGKLKGIAFRKGKECPPFAVHVSNLYKRLPEGSYWNGSLAPVEGSSLGFEYSRYERKPGESYRYPEAAIRVHEGGWQRAMERYSRWAHTVWKGRPLHNRLDDVWDCLSVVASTPTEPANQKSLYDFKTGEWYAGYREDGLDMAEFRHWWKWSEEGPFGVDLSKGKASVMKQMHNRWSYFFFPHPVTKQLLSAVNDGDYDYNPLTGGLEGLKEGLRLAHGQGALVQFYVDPFIVDSTTAMGRNYGLKYSVVNPSVAHTPGPLPESPRDGHVMTYAKWSMCVDNEEYPQLFAKNMARLVRDTQVDSIRMDQLGYTGMTCFNPEHQHRYAEWGEHANLQAMQRLTEVVRTACEAEKPDILLTAEYPGADFLARQLDGALTYELGFWSRSGFRPLPLNIFRFYFPEMKFYDNPAAFKGSHFQDVCFWNGIGMFQRIWNIEYDLILKENTDAFRSAEVSPLVPTLAEFVYGNRFSVPGKALTVFYNSRDESFSGPLLAAPPDDAVHYIDLLALRELPVRNGALSLKIDSQKVGVIGQFKRLLIRHKAGELEVAGSGGGEVVFCRADGSEAARVAVEAGKRSVEIPAAAEGAAVAKLFQGRYIADLLILEN